MLNVIAILLFFFTILSMAILLHVRILSGEPYTLSLSGAGPFVDNMTIILVCFPKSGKGGISTLRSFLEYSPNIIQFRVLVCFDGYNIEKKNKNLHPSCIQTTLTQDIYQQYQQDVEAYLRQKWQPDRWATIVLPHRVCLAGVIRHCMSRVETKYVLLLQDEQRLVKNLDFSLVTRAMENIGANYVLFDTDTYQEHIKKRCRSSTFRTPIRIAQDLVLEKARAFGDSTQVATKGFYHRIALYAMRTTPYTSPSVSLHCLPDRTDRDDMYVSVNDYVDIHRYSPMRSDSDAEAELGVS